MPTLDTGNAAACFGLRPRLEVLTGDDMLAEAVEAIKHYRQFQGDVATAVTRIEEQAYQKQDTAIQQIQQTFQAVRDNARVALAAMDAYLPQKPVTR